MPLLDTAELTLPERAILASSASAAYPDGFSKFDRRLLGVYPEPLVARSRTYHSRGRGYVIEWQDYGGPLPAWFDPLMQGFVDLLTLPPNWDSYGAGQIDPNMVRQAMTLMNSILESSAPAPHVVPLSSSGLQLEWHRNGIDLEVVFDRSEEPYFYSFNRANGEEAERELADPENRLVLRAIINQLL